MTTKNQSTEKLLRDKRGHIYRLDGKTGMIMRVNIHEAIEIEKKFPSIPVPYVNLIKRDQ
jgi:hypothetical protein